MPATPSVAPLSRRPRGLSRLPTEHRQQCKYEQSKQGSRPAMRGGGRRASTVAVPRRASPTDQGVRTAFGSLFRGDGISFTVRAGLIVSRPMGSVRLGMDGPDVLEPGAVGLGLRQMTAQFPQPICLREARSLLPCRVPLRRDRPGGSPPASSWRR